jgi:hypothetical protein
VLERLANLGFVKDRQQGGVLPVQSEQLLLGVLGLARQRRRRQPSGLASANYFGVLTL